MNLKIEIEREADGRWIAEVMGLPSCMAYGDTRVDALTKSKALALRVMIDCLEHGEPVPAGTNCFPLLHVSMGFLFVEAIGEICKVFRSVSRFGNFLFRPVAKIE